MPLARKIYYSSLQAGDEVPSWQAPALSRLQIARYVGAAGDFNPLFIDEPFAKAAGFRSVIAPSALGMSVLSQMLTEWLKAPFIRRLNTKFLKLLWPGDVLTCRGRVTGKRREGSDYLVEIDLWIENQEGEMVVRGSATASLFHSAQDESQRLAGGPPLLMDDPPPRAPQAPLGELHPHAGRRRHGQRQSEAEAVSFSHATRPTHDVRSPPIHLAALACLWAVATSAQGDSPSRYFASRLDPATLDRVIGDLSDAVVRVPGDAESRLVLARAESFWVDLHDDASPAEAIAHLTIGVQAAREALRLVSPGYAEAARAGWPLTKALTAVEAQGATALYWIGANQHALAAERGLASLLLEADDLRRIFARVIELAPETFHGSAFVHQAELALALPAGYAASLGTAGSALSQAERLGPGSLTVDIVWAERWAVKAQDYGTFRRKLQFVLDSSSAVDPDLTPENEIAKRRALRLQKAGRCSSRARPYSAAKRSSGGRKSRPPAGFPDREAEGAAPVSRRLSVASRLR